MATESTAFHAVAEEESVGFVAATAVPRAATPVGAGAVRPFSPRAPRTLDRADLRILNGLRRDGRISHAKLAEQVCLSAASVHERVNRLARDGYIRGYEARLDAVKLGVRVTAMVEVRFKRAEPALIERFAEAVRQHPEITECHLTTGAVDYLLKLRMRDLPTLREFFVTKVAGLPGVRDVHTRVTRELKGTAAPRVHGSHRAGGPGHGDALDEADLHILRLLQDEGRIRLVDLARRTGLRAASVHARVSRLEREGVILRVEPLLDPRLDGGMRVFSEVSLEARAGVEDFRAALRATPQIVECQEVIGEDQFLCKCHVDDLHAYKDMVSSLLRRFPAIRQIRTYAVAEEVKCTGRIAF